MSLVKIAIFASGRGSNAVALIQKAQTLPDKVQISFVLTDRPQAGVLEKAQALGVPTQIVSRTGTKEDHEAEILKIINEHQIDWIFLAGYMRLLSPTFLSTFSGWTGGASQVVNIHPSLLPAYPGVNSIARAFEDKVLETGVTLHLVDEGMDTGRILRQEKVLLSTETALDILEGQIHSLEHKLYAQFLQDVAFERQATKKFTLA